MRYFRVSDRFIKCATTAQLKDVRQDYPQAKEVPPIEVNHDLLWCKVYQGVQSGYALVKGQQGKEEEFR
jgi:hypothetical protein